MRKQLTYLLLVVAEILMLRQLLAAKKKVLFVLPFVSVVEEKVAHLMDIFQPLSLTARGFYANQSAAYFDESIDIAVCTIEKANTLINRMLEQNRYTFITQYNTDKRTNTGWMKSEWS